MGRRSLLTAKIQDKICKTIAGGNYTATAIKAVGIGERTYYDWMKRGELDPESIFGSFHDAVNIAEAEREQRLCLLISKHAENDWRAAAHMLAVMHPDKYSHKHTVRHEGGMSHSHQHELELNLGSLNDDELATLAALLAKARPDEGSEGASAAEPAALHVVGVPGISRELAPSTGGEET